MSASVSSSSRIRLFKNERLEKLTLISPWVFTVSWGIMLPALAVFAWQTTSPVDNPFATLGHIALGLLIWVLFEYTLHRYLFHLETSIRPFRWFVYLIHGNHHDSPKDRLRSLMPFSVSIPVSALVWLALEAMLGAQGTWALFGFLTGYVLYDGIHYACHQWTMSGRIGRALKRHHMRHHYAHTAGNFAISAIFLDRLFGSKITSLKR